MSGALARMALKSLGSVFIPIARQALGNIVQGVVTKSMRDVVKLLDSQNPQQLRGNMQNLKNNFQSGLKMETRNIISDLSKSLKRTGEQAIGQLTGSLTKKLFM